MTTIKNNNPSSYYSSMDRNNNDDQLFSDEQIQRYDADTIKNRYGENWRNYTSNVREIKQADGSIVREYIIEDPGLLKEIKPSSTGSTSSSTSSEDEQQSSKHKFAQIKAKFEQKTFTNVMASPSSSSVASSHTTTTRRNSNKSTDDLNIRNRRESNRTNPNIPQSTTHSQQSRSVSNSSFQRLHSADEADEEVRHIHRHQSALTPITSIDESKEQSNVQYEVVDEDGNPMAIDDVHDLIKMSGVTAREVPQPDGTVIREYVIDDPNVLSKFQSQQQQQQQQQNSHEHTPPPPPRIPLRQSALLRQEPLSKDHYPPINIQQVRTLEPQRRYEFITTSGKRIEFILTSLGSDESDVHELANAINTRLLPTPSQQPPPFTLPKPWHPAVDLTHRTPQPGPDNQNLPFDQSAPYQQQFAPVYAEPIIDWSAVQQQDPHGQVDPQFIRQYITQKHQTGGFQTSAQFLPDPPPPQQQQHSANSPSKTKSPIYYQQTTTATPYQGQQQQQQFNYNQQQIPFEHTRI